MSIVICLPVWWPEPWPHETLLEYRIPENQSLTITMTSSGTDLTLPDLWTISQISGADAAFFNLSNQHLTFIHDSNVDDAYHIDMTITDGVSYITYPILIIVEETTMTTAYEEISNSLGVLADEVGDLKERQTASETTIAELQSQFNSINLEDIIDDAAPNTATNVTRSASFINTLFEQAKAEIRGGVDTAYDTLKKVADALLGLSGRVDQLELEVANLKAKFDAAGNLKVEFMPESLRNGIQFKGFFDPSTQVLPVASSENESWMYKIHNVADPSSVTPISMTLNAGTVNEMLVEALPGDTLMSDGQVWVKMGRSDVITKVNGKTGDVVLVAGDIQYSASNESGLSSGSIKDALDTLGAMIKAKFAEIGVLAQLMTASQLKARIAAAASDGVATAI